MRDRDETVAALEKYLVGILPDTTNVMTTEYEVRDPETDELLGTDQDFILAVYSYGRLRMGEMALLRGSSDDVQDVMDVELVSLLTELADHIEGYANELRKVRDELA